MQVVHVIFKYLVTFYCQHLSRFYCIVNLNICFLVKCLHMLSHNVFDFCQVINYDYVQYIHHSSVILGGDNTADELEGFCVKA